MLCGNLFQHALNSGTAVGQHHEVIDLAVTFVIDIIIAVVCGCAHGGGIAASHLVFLD